jgi:hypothetical protein
MRYKMSSQVQHTVQLSRSWNDDVSEETLQTSDDLRGQSVGILIRDESSPSVNTRTVIVDSSGDILIATVREGGDVHCVETVLVTDNSTEVIGGV